MITKTIFSGFGGQGVLMMGYSLSMAAMNHGFHVTFLPSYGAEMRGGTANCTVCVADEEIASPIASEPDCLVAMNAPSLNTFQNRLGHGGSLFMNSSIIKAPQCRRDVLVCAVPCNELAEKVDNPRGANMVMMGAFLAVTGLIPPERYVESLLDVLGAKKKALLETNRKALEAGLEFIRVARQQGVGHHG